MVFGLSLSVASRLLPLVAVVLPWMMAGALLWPEAGPLVSWRQWPGGAAAALAFADLGLGGGRGALAYGLAWGSLAGLTAVGSLPPGLRWMSLAWGLSASPLGAFGQMPLFWIPSVSLEDVAWRGPLMALLPLLAHGSSARPVLLACAAVAGLASGQAGLGVVAAILIARGRAALRLALAAGCGALAGVLLPLLLSAPWAGPVSSVAPPSVWEMLLCCVVALAMARLSGIGWLLTARVALAVLGLVLLSPGAPWIGLLATAWLCLPGPWSLAAFAPAVAAAAFAVQVSVAGVIFLDAPSQKARLDEPLANGLFPEVPYVLLPLEAARLRVLFHLGINIRLVDGADPLRPDLSDPRAFPYPPLAGRIIQDLDDLRKAAGTPRLQALRGVWPGWLPSEMPLISGRVVFVDAPTKDVPLAVPFCGAMLPSATCGTDEVAARDLVLRAAGLSPGPSTASFVLWLPRQEVP